MAPLSEARPLRLCRFDERSRAIAVGFLEPVTGSIRLGAAVSVGIWQAREVHKTGGPTMKVHALLASAVLLASPAVFAQDDLCQLNLQEIDDNMATNTATLGEPAKSQVDEYVKQARQAQQSGDTEACIAHSTKALQELKGPGSTGSGGTAGSGSGGGN